MATVCVVLLLTLLPGALSQVFRDSPADATVLTNFPTTLSCAAPDPSPPNSIVWTFNDVLASSGPPRVVITYDTSTGISEYQISSVNYFDEGSYQCFALNSQGMIVSESNVAVLTVQGIPAFAPTIPPVTAPLGGEAVFECRVLSNPPATSTSWSFHDLSGTTRELNFTSTGRVIVTQSSVTITSILATDEGFYDCTAENAFGRNTTSGRLFIGDPPSPLVLTITPSAPGPITINETDTLVLTCGISDSDQIASIQWLRGGALLTTGVSHSPDALSLAIASAGFADGGVYTCSARSVSGINVTASISVIVQVAPVITEAPEDFITLENQPLSDVPVCQATGEPRPSIVWLHPDGSLVPVLSGEPQFGVIARSDVGVYVCVASNNAGTARAEFTINVQGPPVFVLAPEDTEASYGQDVLVSCIADGIPEPRITWGRVGVGGLPVNSVVTETELHLFSVTLETSAVYVCMAVNDEGEVRREFSITVLDPPQIISATDRVAVLIGDRFILDCVTTGPPSSVLTWQLNGTLLAPSSDPRLSVFPNGSLAVSNPPASYSGLYTCNISTSYAFASAQISVTVGAVPDITVAPQDSDLAPGEAIFLDCLPGGTPQPRTRWFHTDPLGVRTELSSSVVGETFTVFSTGLELRGVSRVDSGVYECVADNTFGSATGNARLRVEGAPLATGISPSEVVAGDDATIICSVLYNFPETGTTWRRASREELPSERFTVRPDGSLSISPVLEDDQEVYSCRASNSYGSSESNATLIVNVRPAITLSSNETTAVLDDSTVLSCPATGRPAPTIQWTLADGRDAAASQPSRYFFNSFSGELVLNNIEQGDAGVFTCTAANAIGSASVDVAVEVRGAAVSSLAVLVLGTSLMQITWSAPPPSLTRDLLSYELQFSASRDTNPLTFVFAQTQFSYIALGLSAGTEYRVVVTALYSNNVRGIETSMLASTAERPPTGPPESVVLTPLEEAMEISWTLPAPGQRNGVITFYNIFYRVSPREDNATIAATFPFTLVEYPRENVTEEEVQTLVVGGLEGREVYEVKVQAGNSVGIGPNSTVSNVTTLPVRVYTPFPFQLTQTLIIAILASLIGIALVVIVVMSVSVLGYICWKRARREGRHKPLTEEGEFDRQQRRRSSKNKEKRVVSGPIPGITPHIDSSVEGKFTVQSKDGRVIPLNPKIITEGDVAPPPVPGENVQKVPRKDILKSHDYDEYTVPSDSLGEVRQRELAQQVRSGGEGVKMAANRGSGIYSEPSKQSKPVLQGETDISPYAEVRRTGTSGEGGEGGEGVRQGAASDGVEQSPSHDTSHDTTRDDQKLIYASVSTAHVVKKREKKLKEQQRIDLKAEKEQRRMAEKMERETKKQEARARKEAEKEGKKRAKEEAVRQSMGLSNVVRMHELDFNSKEGKAQAQFIDAATAAIF